MALHTALVWIAALFLASSVFGHTVSLRLTLLGTGILLAAAVTYREKENKLRFLPPIWLPFLLWGAWAVASVTWSLEPERSLKEWRNEVFYTGAALWVCYVAAQARDAARVFLPVLGIAGATACLIALRDFARGLEHYMAGWHGGPGDHSSALLVLLPAAVMTAWAVQRQKAWWNALTAMAMAALFFASAYTTLNRMVWLAFAIQFLTLGGLLLVRRNGRSGAKPGLRGRIAAYTLAGAAIAGCGAVVLSIQAEREAAGIAKAFEQDPRLALWPEAAERIGQRPLAGYGFGRGLLRDAFQAKFNALDTHLWHAHNLFLETLLQLGIPGMALFLLLLGSVLRNGWHIARDDDETAAACGMALLAIVTGMLVRNMTDALLVRQNALLFWGTTGVLLALGNLARNARA
jgi:O-antigen ligase